MRTEIFQPRTTAEGLEVQKSMDAVVAELDTLAATTTPAGKKQQLSGTEGLRLRAPPSLKGHCSGRLHSLILRVVIQAWPMAKGCNFSLVRALLDGQGSSKMDEFSLQPRQLYRWKSCI